MHLVVGHSDDTICGALVDRLLASGHEAKLIHSPLEEPARQQLRIDPDGTCSTTLTVDDVPAECIESVFVRSSGALDPAGWAPADHAYMQAELQAAMLAWLSALDCPVINRVDAELWYRARLPLLHWMAPLRACNLFVPDFIISSDEAEILAFRDDLAQRGVAGAVFLSLAQQNSWLVGPEEWDGVAALGRHVPVYLAEPHGPVSLLCVVGGAVVWDGEPTSGEAALSGRLLQFTRTVGLEFVELGLATVHAGLAVVHISLMPRMELFSARAQDRIVDRLAQLLAPEGSRDPAKVQP